MRPLEELIHAEIAAAGPMAFSRFMELALYHPVHGYYRRERGRDPFGVEGDFFTAEQLQPVFGILIGQCVRALWRELGEPANFTVVELGAGRGEMRDFFPGFRYIPVDVDSGDLPRRFTGVVFGNEFFDALPVDSVVRRGCEYREMRVDSGDGRFVWRECGPVAAETATWLDGFAAPLQEGALIEVNLRALEWMARIAAALERGFVMSVDYGYTRREAVRFPRGTLMSYRRHAALEDVLAEPGERDITAHVCFSALEERGAELGLERVRFETLARTLLRAGEEDQFAAALEAPNEAGRRARTLQLKTLLFGMGETFRVLLQRK